MLTTLLLQVWLIQQLGNDDFKKREYAETTLAGYGLQARATLGAGRKSNDIEIARRCQYLYEKTTEQVLASFEPVPEIDAAWYNSDPRWYDRSYYPRYDSEKYEANYNRLHPYLLAVGCDGYPWDHYYEATRLWLRDELNQGTPVQELTALVDTMRKRDMVFLWYYHHPSWYYEEQRYTEDGIPIMNPARP